jgi:uncharacterized membrane protein YqhA
VPDVTGAGHRADPPVPPENRRGLLIQRRFERFLALSRLLTLIPVIFLLFDAAGSFIYGADILIRTADGDLGEPSRVGGRLGIFLIVMDTFLVGATLLIVAFGFYELFVLRRERPGHLHWLPSWLVMRDLEDLKARVTSMLILVAAITFVDILVESHDERGVLFLGLGIAAIIIALTVFLRFGRKDGAARGVAADPVPAADPLAPGPSSFRADLEPAAQDPPDWPVNQPDRRRSADHDAQARRTVVAIGSLSTLDLREAAPQSTTPAATRIAVRLVAVLGQVTVLVPDGMQVADSGLTFLGVRSVTGHASAPAPDIPVLVTTGVSILGRVKIARVTSGGMRHRQVSSPDA